MSEESRHDKSWLVFILPFAIIVFVIVAIWLLSFGWTTKAGFTDADNAAVYVKGAVIKNVVPADRFSGSGYIEVLTDENDVYTVYFENSSNGCVSDSASKDGEAAIVGSKIIAFGLPVESKQIQVCSSDYFYIKNTGTAAPYANWLLYTDANAGIEFKYPPNWKIATSTGSIGKITRVLSASSSEPALEITVFAGAGSFELAEWAKQFYGADAGAPQGTTIAGASAIVVPVKDGLGSRNVLLLKQGDQMLQFSFPPPETKDKNLVALPALILKSISFVNSASIPETPKSTDSGVSGTVTIGPTCPVMQYFPEEQCKDRPYTAKLLITDKNHAVVARVPTNDAGFFKIPLQPGTYRIENDSAATMPRLNPTEFVVTQHGYTYLTLIFDSGIR